MTLTNFISLSQEQAQELIQFADQVIQKCRSNPSKQSLKTIEIYTDLREKIQEFSQLSPRQLKIFIQGSRVLKIDLSDNVRELLLDHEPAPKPEPEPQGTYSTSDVQELVDHVVDRIAERFKREIAAALRDVRS